MTSVRDERRTSVRDDRRADSRLQRAHADFVAADGPGAARPVLLLLGAVRAAVALGGALLAARRGADPRDLPVAVLRRDRSRRSS